MFTYGDTAAGVAPFIGVVLVILVLVIILTSCVKIVPQATAYVVERLGGYQATWSVGIHFKVPVIDRDCKKSYFKGTGCGFCTSAGYYKMIMLRCE